MGLKTAKIDLLNQRARLLNQLETCNKNIEVLEKEIESPKFPKEIIEPLAKEFKKLEKNIVLYKTVPVKMKIILSWSEELRVDAYQDVSTWPSIKSLKDLDEYKQYKKEINALNAKIQRAADKLEVDIMEIWAEVTK